MLNNLTFSNLSSKVTTDKLISTIQSKFKRRNAVCHKFKVLDHEFDLTPIPLSGLKCSLCRNSIFSSAQKCKQCNLACHKRCLSYLNAKCAIREGELPRHHFKSSYFTTPTHCDHCGSFIEGVFHEQGVKCRLEDGGCDMRVHFECKDIVRYPCCPEGMQTNETKDRVEQSWYQVRIEDFDLIKVLGSGSIAKVYLAKLKQTQKRYKDQREYAIKAIRKDHIAVNDDPEKTFTEQRALKLGRQHPFLTLVYCCFQSKERLYYVMEHVPGQDLYYHLNKEIRWKFTENRARFYSAEIVLALIYLHQQGIIYRDLKLENVLLDEDGHCKLLDFSLSKELDKTENRTTRTLCGTPHYMSPETIKELDYGFSVDWWALGVIMYEMLVGESPFEAEQIEQLYKKILEDDVEYPLSLSQESQSILEGLLNKDPHSRLGCSVLEGLERGVLNHPFFRDIDWNDLKEKRTKPPYKPTSEDLKSFRDPDNGEEKQHLTPVDSDVVKGINQAEFKGFSYYSESFRSDLKSN